MRVLRQERESMNRRLDEKTTEVERHRREIDITK